MNNGENINEWPTNASDYQIIEQIGQGAFAKVWNAYCPKKEYHVAIKIMELEKVTSSFEDIRTEVQSMKMTLHSNILTCHCSFVIEDQLWLVMDLMEKGSCLHVMNYRRKHGLPDGLQEEFCAIILREALCGLNYLHENGQIHRDVKAGNILLDGQGRVLLADFGVSGWLMEGGDHRKQRQTFVGTPCWMAPEVMEQIHGYDYKADIWSFGITALELARGYAPYAKYQPMKVLLLTVQDDPPSLKSYPENKDDYPFSKQFKDMVKLCLQKDPNKRPTTSALLKHAFFKKSKDANYLVDNLLSKIENIGQVNSQYNPDTNPGTKPLYYREASELDKSNKKIKHVPGTTWVFDDDDDNETKKDNKTCGYHADISIDEFEKQFSEVTGGEKYRTE